MGRRAYNFSNKTLFGDFKNSQAFDIALFPIPLRQVEVQQGFVRKIQPSGIYEESKGSVISDQAAKKEPIKAKRHIHGN